jgi:hypothetical protein
MTLMEVENDNDSLPRFDILEPFEVSCVDDKRSLHIGDGPMPGNIFGIGVHETYGYHFDEQFHFLLPPCKNGNYRAIESLFS